MHIPDGFVDAKTALATAVLSAGGLGVALRQARLHLPPRKIPLLGLSAAFIFAAQMINFPVPGATSGHLIGGVLASILLGPSAAIVVLAAVLIVQCFLFNDGGPTALGANIFNIALVNSILGYAIYFLFRRLIKGTYGQVAAAAFAAWCGTLLAALCCAGEIAISGKAQWGVIFPAMIFVHMLIGIGEGLITAMVVSALLRTRPELIENNASTSGPVRYGEFAFYGLLVSLGLAIFVSPFASPWPDGLEKVARTLGFEHHAAAPLLNAPISDYALPGIASTSLATALAGAIGTLIVFVLCLLLARILVPKSPTPSILLPTNNK